MTPVAAMLGMAVGDDLAGTPWDPSVTTPKAPGAVVYRWADGWTVARVSSLNWLSSQRGRQRDHVRTWNNIQSGWGALYVMLDASAVTQDAILIPLDNDEPRLGPMVKPEWLLIEKPESFGRWLSFLRDLVWPLDDYVADSTVGVAPLCLDDLVYERLKDSAAVQAAIEELDQEEDPDTVIVPWLQQVFEGDLIGVKGWYPSREEFEKSPESYFFEFFLEGSKTGITLRFDRHAKTWSVIDTRDGYTMASDPSAHAALVAAREIFPASECEDWWAETLVPGEPTFDVEPYDLLDVLNPVFFEQQAFIAWAKQEELL